MIVKSSTGSTSIKNGMVAVVFTALAFSAARAAPVVEVNGDLRADGEPVSGVFTVTVEVSDDDGNVLDTQVVNNLAINDGTFAVELDLEPGRALLEEGDVLTVTTDLGDGLVATARLGSVLFAASADAAEIAGIAVVAERLGDIPANELVDQSQISSVAVAFLNLANVPEGIADGDDGNVLSLQGLAVNAGRLEVSPSSVTSAAVQNGTITGAQILDGSINGDHTGVTSGQLQTGTLTGANFANNAFASTDFDTTNVFVRPTGCESPGLLTTQSSCTRRTCEGVPNGRVNCTSSACLDVGTNPSNALLTCSGSSEGMGAVGKLVR
jgi:hypothetical protein